MGYDEIYLMGALILLVGSACAYYWLISLQRQTQPSTSQSAPEDSPTKTDEPCERFQRELQAMRSKMGILDQYSGDYFHAFQAGGWAELQRLVHEVSLAEDRFNDYLRSRRFDDAELLAMFLMGQAAGDDLQRARQMFVAFRGLENWPTRSHALVTTLTQVLATAATETQALGVRRVHRKRKPTLVTTSEIQDVLLRK